MQELLPPDRLVTWWPALRSQVDAGIANVLDDGGC